MKRYLLDTSALLAHSRREPGWEEVQALFENDDTDILLAAVSLTEFARRLKDLGAGPAKAWSIVEDYRRLASEVVAVDVRVAHEAFEVHLATSRRLPLVDALIAAAARVHDATLVHRDEHLSAIPAAVVRQICLPGPRKAGARKI